MGNELMCSRIKFLSDSDILLANGFSPVGVSQQIHHALSVLMQVFSQYLKCQGKTVYKLTFVPRHGKKRFYYFLFYPFAWCLSHILTNETTLFS